MQEYLMKHQNINSVYKINNGYDFLVECVFKHIKDLEDFMESLEERFRVDDKQVYYVIEDIKREDFGTHAQNVTTGQDLGLTFHYALVSNLDDWDNYEGLQTNAAETWAAATPTDPDREEILTRSRQSQTNYLQWGREALGWAIYVFKK